MYSRVFIFFIKKKRWLKRQDSNLESFNYESGTLPNQPTLFKKHNRHIKCTSKLTPWLPRWQPYCKMTDLHLDHLLYLLHSCNHYYQSRRLPLAQGPWRYFCKTVRGAHYQTARRAFFFSPEFWGLLPIFFLPDCTGATILMMAAFFPVENDPFSIIVYTYYTLAFTATYTTLAPYFTSNVAAFDHSFFPTTRLYGGTLRGCTAPFLIWGLLP